MIFLIFGKSFVECSRAMHTLIYLLRQLGFAINWSKVEGPSQQLVFLGVVADSVSMTLALPTSKLADFSNLLRKFSQKKTCMCLLVGNISGKAQLGLPSDMRRLRFSSESVRFEEFSEGETP